MQFEFRQVDWPFATPFRIAYRQRTHAQTVLVELKDGDHVGRGEGLGVSYHGETVDTLLAQLSELAPRVRNGITRADLAALLPPGGARNAVDCALWDLEAKRAGQRAWTLAGVDDVRELVSAFTLGLSSPEETGQAAAAVAQYTLLKLKLSGEGDLERVRAVRLARPDARIIVDANQAWNEQQLHELTPELAALGVELIEQPLPAGRDAALAQFVSPVPLCADESCQSAESLGGLRGKYSHINIKLDKTGGLTEALRLARAARAAGFKLMVGCMAGSSLSMAPAFVVGQFSDVVDLDGPLLAKTDVAHGIRYQGSRMSVPEAALWG